MRPNISLVSESLFPSQTSKKKSLSTPPDWSLLPEELFQIISMHLKNPFDVVHARSVCNLWRSAFPFPSRLLRRSYSLPLLPDSPLESKDLFVFEKIPLFLFTVQTPQVSPSPPFEFYLGGLVRDETNYDLPTPLECSVIVNKAATLPFLKKSLDGQIFPLGHMYRAIDFDVDVACLWLDKDGVEEFVVLVRKFRSLFVLRSSEMKWMRIQNVPNDAYCTGLLAFRSRFYATISTEVFVIDPYSPLEATLLMPSDHRMNAIRHLVPCGDNDELFLVEKTIRAARFTLRVSRLDQEAGKWVVVSDLGEDRVLFIGNSWNVSCSAKEFPDGCCVSGNSVLITENVGIITYSYKYEVHTENEDDDGYCWRYSSENCVWILSTCPVLALLVKAAFDIT
ncbi:unnamed protein product [Cochlearia groenlandica]